MPAEPQAKLLRVLETARDPRASAAWRRVAVDVRFVAATNRDLDDEHRGRQLPAGPLLPARTASPCTSRRCASARGDLAPLVGTSWRGFAARRGAGAAPDASPRSRRACSRRTRGPATCASCATSSSARCCCARIEILPEHLPIEGASAAHSVSFAASTPASPSRRPRRPGRMRVGCRRWRAAHRARGRRRRRARRILRVLAEHGGNQTQAAKALGDRPQHADRAARVLRRPRPRKPGRSLRPSSAPLRPSNRRRSAPTESCRIGRTTAPRQLRSDGARPSRRETGGARTARPLLTVSAEEPFK